MIGVPRWNPVLAGFLFGFFLLVDLLLFSANLWKIEEGGWFPVVVAMAAFWVMSTWMRGRSLVQAERQRESMPLEAFLASIRPDRPGRVAGPAIFMTGNSDPGPAALLANPNANNGLHGAGGL